MTRALAVAAVLAAWAAPSSARPAPSPYVPDELLVKHASGTAAQHRAAAAARSHRVIAELQGGWAHVRIRPGESLPAALAAWAADPAVEWVQPNFLYRATAFPNDPGYPQQWALRNTGQTIASALQPPATLIATGNPGLTADDIDVEPAWSVTTDCRGAIVAVLDSGVNYLHEDLAANMWDGGPSYPLHGWDFVDGDSDPMDRHGHGTHVAGIIGAAGNNGIGTSGVCWSARIMAVRALDQLGVGTTASIVPGIDFAIARGAKIINMSIGGGGTFDAAYSAAFTRAQSAGVLVVVAAGNEANDNDAGPVYPCSFTQPNILCVAALDQRYALASFSNFGATSVDLGAPGTNILSTWPGTQAAGTEDFTTGGWVGSSSTAGSGGGWGFLSIGGVDYLADPPAPAYGSSSYNAGTDDRVWKAFDLSGADVVTVDFQVAIDLAAGDSAQIACKAAGGDPFSGGTSLETSTGDQTHQSFVPVAVNASACAAATTTFGFRLASLPGTTGNLGVVVGPLAFKLLAYDTHSYNTIAGTSMATPVVSGVAALLASYHPAYGYADVKSALVAAGRDVPALAGKTSSGKAVDAMASLAYVHPPTGLAAVVH